MSRCIPKNSALVHRHSRRGLASGQSSWGQSFMHYSSQDYGADGVVVSLTTRGTFTHWKEGGHAGWCKQNFYRVDRHDTSARGSGLVVQCVRVGCAVGLARLLCLLRCCHCHGHCVAWTWAAWRAVLPLALSPAQNLDRQRWFWTAGSQRRPFKAAGDLQTRPGRRKRGAPSVCRMPIRGLWEAWLA